MAGIKRVGDMNSIEFQNGLLTGVAWSAKHITYGFPSMASDYNYGPFKSTFSAFSPAQERAVSWILDKDFGGQANNGFSIEGFTNLQISEGSGRNSVLRYAESSISPSQAGIPQRGEQGGDVWITDQANYSNPQVGTQAWLTFLHETGHALGLKHPHTPMNGNQTVPDDYDELAWTVMSYKSNSDSPDNSPYTNEKFGFPQTFMAGDILALQHMYGVNKTVNSGDTTYTWKPASGDLWVNGKLAIDAVHNRILATIWDGGGDDTYNLSAYKTDLSIDLRPNTGSFFSAKQCVDTGSMSGSSYHLNVNVMNAFINKNEGWIEGAAGGRGNDRFVANSQDNWFHGGKGADVFEFHGTYSYEWGGRDIINDFKNGVDKLYIQSFEYTNEQLIQNALREGSSTIIFLGHGDRITLQGFNISQLDLTDFYVG